MKCNIITNILPATVEFRSSLGQINHSCKISFKLSKTPMDPRIGGFFFIMVGRVVDLYFHSYSGQSQNNERPFINMERRS